MLLLYINDLQNVFLQSVVHHFADHTNPLFSPKSSCTIEFVINDELKRLVQFLRSNKLSLEETKTDPIKLSSLWMHIPREPDIRKNNNKLKFHSHIRYLGMIIDEVLS